MKHRNKKETTIQMKGTDVNRSHVTIVNWTNDRGEQERLISWNDEHDGEPIVVQLSLVRRGRNWSARIEEWHADSPELLRIGRNEIYLDKTDEID